VGLEHNNPLCFAQTEFRNTAHFLLGATMKSMTLRFPVLMTALALLILLAPFFTRAYPFGGQARIVIPCYYNQTIYASLGPPRGGEYIWTTATKTYLFGPPRHAGQWLLGLAGAPYYCIYQIAPNRIKTGSSIIMMGSSQ